MLDPKPILSQRPLIPAALAAALAVTTPLLAQLHEGDVILAANSGAVVTGAAGPLGIQFPQRVFLGEFGDLGLENRTADPGFNSVPNQFVTNALVDVRIRRAARKWSSEDRNFCQTPEELVEIRKGTRIAATPAADPADPSQGPAITVGATDPADGLIHQHPAYWLTAPFSEGVYLVEIQVEAAPLAPSAPLWLLFSQNADAQTVEDAVEFAEATLAAPGASGNLCRCPSDEDDNGVVDLADLIGFLSGWQPLVGQAGDDLQGDRNNDGVVDLADLVMFLERWLPGC